MMGLLWFLGKVVELHARLTHLWLFLHRKVNPLPVTALAGLLVIWGSKLNTINGGQISLQFNIKLDG